MRTTRKQASAAKRARVELGRRIGELREAKGLSRAELAAALDVKVPSVHDWENGETSPALSRMLDLARVLDTTVDDLLSNLAAA